VQVFVPTPETVSLRFFLDMMLALKKPIMFVGGAGTVGARQRRTLQLITAGAQGAAAPGNLELFQSLT
jgi:dynein heavy chain